jgi:hypothetical protein
MDCGFEVTNENLYAIEKGLNPKKGDNIYSICASGDVPFMMVVNGAKVCAVDYKENQIKHVQERINYLKKNDLERFNFYSMNSYMFSETSIYYDSFVTRDEYFSRVDHNKIKENLEGLELKIGDFFNSGEDFSKFNKVYLSNICDHYLRDNSEASLIFKMNSFIEQFNPNTLFYMIAMSKHGDILNFKFVKKEDKLSDKLTEEDGVWGVHIFKRIGKLEGGANNH